MIMKKIALCLLLSQLLACTAVKSPTPDKLPETPQAALTQFPNQDEYYKNQIVEPINKIVAYFDKDGELTKKTNEAYYYRIHLGNAKNGDVVVQDFYADTKTKQNSIILIDKVDLLKFNQLTSIRNPFTHSVSKKGELISLKLYKNGFPQTQVFRSNDEWWALTPRSCEDFSELKSTAYIEDQIKVAESLLIKDENTTCTSPKIFNLTLFDKNGGKITEWTIKIGN